MPELRPPPDASGRFQGFTEYLHIVVTGVAQMVSPLVFPTLKQASTQYPTNKRTHGPEKIRASTLLGDSNTKKRAAREETQHFTKQPVACTGFAANTCENDGSCVTGPKSRSRTFQTSRVLGGIPPLT